MKTTISKMKAPGQSGTRSVAIKLLGTALQKQGMTYWSVSQYGLTAKQYSQIKSGQPLRKKRKDAIELNEELKEKVTAFWYSIARELPLHKRVKKHKSAFIIECSFTDAFKLFKNENQEIKIGFCSFLRLKPSRIRQ